MKTLKRMWVNQPSTLQPLHELHGTNVLAYEESENMTCSYFLHGHIISQQIPKICLSNGWNDGRNDE